MKCRSRINLHQSSSNFLPIACQFSACKNLAIRSDSPNSAIGTNRNLCQRGPSYLLPIIICSISSPYLIFWIDSPKTITIGSDSNAFEASTKTLPWIFSLWWMDPDLIVWINSINTTIYIDCNLAHPSFIDFPPYTINSRFCPYLIGRIDAYYCTIDSNSNILEPSIYPLPTSIIPILSPQLIICRDTIESTADTNANLCKESRAHLPIISIALNRSLTSPYSIKKIKPQNTKGISLSHPNLILQIYGHNFPTKSCNYLLIVISSINNNPCAIYPFSGNNLVGSINSP